MTSTFALIAKEPASGRAKTRLARVLGPARAVELAEAMLLDAADSLAAAAPVDARLVLYHDPPDAAERLRGLGLPARYRLVGQPPGSLGTRLAALAAAELARGATACVIAATDSPFALRDVQDCVPTSRDEVVLAPCADGGYWAIGLARPSRLTDVPMPAPDVLGATMARARDDGFRVRLLPATLDLDEVADLERADADGLLARAPRTAAAWAAAAATAP